MAFCYFKQKDDELLLRENNTVGEGDIAKTVLSTANVVSFALRGHNHDLEKDKTWLHLRNVIGPLVS